MMKRLACAFAVISLALTGCGGSICEDFKDVVEDVEEKAEPCDDGSSGGIEVDVDQCEESLEKCTDDDKKAIENYIDCLGDVKTCEKGKEQEFAGAIERCDSQLDNLSTACAASQEIQRKAASYSISR